VASVAGQEYHLRQVAGNIEGFVETWPAVEVLEVEITVHSPDE
jgi:hypothetical protein